MSRNWPGRTNASALRNSPQFITYERIFSNTALGQFSFFNRHNTARLTSNPDSTPVVASQNRTLQNTGGIVAISLSRGTHNIKFGGQFTITPVREHFSFYPTVAFDDLADEDGESFPNPINSFNASQSFPLQWTQDGANVERLHARPVHAFPQFHDCCRAAL